MYRWRAVFFVAAACLHGAKADSLEPGNGLGTAARQMVVCLAPKSTSFAGTLQLFERDRRGEWQPHGSPWPVLFAPRGLAWGRGLNPPQPGLQKKSDDHRNPEGLFKIGFALGYAAKLPAGAQGWPYHQVTARDAWIDEASLPGYNHLYTLPPGAPRPSWWNRERLHLGDDAYQWMLLIEHNYEDAVPGDGTEIFFHIRRGEHYRTAGCTTMAKENLLTMIKWLQPGSNAMLAELTVEHYREFWKAWGLPPPREAIP
jgi:hypothetical protein